MPNPLVQFVLPVSAASYHIYLFHRILPDWLLPQPDPAIVQPLLAVIAVTSGVAVGMAAFALQKAALGMFARRRAEPDRRPQLQGA